MSKKVLLSGALACGLVIGAAEADAAVDAEIMFVIDQSGSMGGEFNFLGGAISGFLADLQADARIDTAKAGLIAYESSPTLYQDLTDDATALSNAFNTVPVFGGRENAYGAIDAGLPGGNTDFNISYSANAVKSLVLITDEDADDASFYSNSFGLGESAIADYLDDEGFLLNIIYNVGFGDEDFDDIARPATGLFDIQTFRNDRQAFFTDFTNTKITEITTPPAVIPLPAGLPLMLLGIGGLGLYRQARRKSAA